MVTYPTETMYAIRRADGEPLYGEWSFAIVGGPDDWEPAETDVEGCDGPVTYELVEMQVTVKRTRTLPMCSERCGRVAEFWGLCEAHALEDDPDTVREMIAARSDAR